MSKEFKAGDEVYYSPIIGGPHQPKAYKIDAITALADGTMVAWLKGRASCVSLKALTHKSAVLTSCDQ